MSTQTDRHLTRAIQLGDAVMRMATRYGQAERCRASAVADYIHGRGAEAKVRTVMARWDRACERRYNALYRLTAALRDLSMKEEK